jgi:hypothetical protein
VDIGVDITTGVVVERIPRNGIVVAPKKIESIDPRIRVAEGVVPKEDRVPQ